MMIERFRAALARLWSDTGAHFALTTAICAVPLFGMMGLSIDYGILLSNKTKLDAAADAAAVAAVTKAKAVLNGGGTLVAAEAAGQTQGVASFQSNSGLLAFQSTAGAITPVVTFQPTLGQTLNVTVSYSMTSQSQFGKFFNIVNHTISGSAGSSTVVVPFYQFVFVVDISGSMSIGATSTDITNLQNNPSIQCAFACHDPYHNRGPDYESIAHQAGYKLKIDYVNSAVSNFITDLKAQTNGIPGNFSVGIDTFATSFNVLQAPSINDFTAASAAAATIDVEPMAPLSISQGYTRTTTSLQAALTGVTNIGTGDGSSVTNQATYFIFLSDGVEDIEGNVIYGRGTDVSYTSACSQIKAAHATMISIAAPYPVITNDPQQYPVLVAPLAPPATPNYQSAMQACASDGTWFYQANDGPGINTAVSSVLARILQGLTRITN